MSKQFARLMQHRRKRKKGDTAELAAQLAPLEEQDRQAAEQQGARIRSPDNDGPTNEQGAIVVDTGRLILPKDVTEVAGRSLRRIEPVVVVILIVMLSFIAIIAWQISQMPE